jgi:hypothetical protein
LVNTNAPVQTQSPSGAGTSGSPLVNTTAPVQGSSPVV